MRKSSWLVLILSLALITRLLFLDSPANEYFDEVYHAFTARQILHANPKAWEWWNPHPPGFAYEWTHPPLAKEIMAISMLVLGEKAMAWRLPGALAGTISVYLVYLIAKELLNKKVGLLAAGVLALDGLFLTMSRIGMNDIYFLVFALASFYFFLPAGLPAEPEGRQVSKRRIFLSALMLGLAAASKWTVFWFLPILLISHLSLKRRITKSYFWFFLLPPIIYLASYTPMFLTGHSLKTFWQLQQQMWWYHTGLKATHAYTSPWWSWPFLMRPIYLYVSETGNLIAKIYALGNPMVFWFGFVAIIFGSWQAYQTKNKKLGLVIFSYLAFFVPWAVSPRIMFLYHYLPSMPFLAIVTGWVLNRYPKLILPFYFTSFLLFIYFYPHWIGIKIPLWLDNSYYWFSSWR